MKRMFKRLSATLLTLILLIGSVPISANAATSHTADEAISWCESQVGKSLDYDGVYGAQCVDLIKYYYKYLGCAAVGGNACDYASYSACPSGWTLKPGGIPEKGDILIYTGGYGHVAIYESDNTSYHQNWNGQYVQKVYRPYNQSIKMSVNPDYGIDSGITKTYWGCIHPDFTSVSYLYTSITPGTYYLKNLATGTYLCLYNGVDANKQNFCVYNFSNGSKAELFEISSAGDGYKMRPLCSSSRIVNAWGSSPSSGSNVNLYDDCSESSQWWKFEAVNGGYILHNSYIPSCVLDTDGENVLIATRHGRNSQIWELVRFTESHTHTWNSGSVTKAPTCTASGTKTYTCTGCGEKKTENIAAKGHTAVTVSGTPATCTTVGLTNGSKCSSCEAVLTAQETIAALEHAYNLANIETSCESVTATYVCSRCEKIYQEISNNGVLSDWSDTKPTGISEDLIETKTQYRYSEKATTQSASATLSGWTKYDAKITGWTAWSAWQNNAVTASSSREVKTQYISPTYKTVWHYDRSVSSDGKYSTYGTSYYPNYQSITLDYRLSSKGTVDGQTHYGSYDGGYGTYLQNYWWNERSESVVNTAGYTQYSYRDAVYTYYFYKWSDMSDWQDDPVVNNNSTKVETRTLYRYKLPGALGHDLIHYEGKNSTCTENGWTPYDTCSRCDYTTYQVIISQGHSYIETVIAPTPAAQGYTLHTCTACGSSYKSDHTDYAISDPTAIRAVIETKTAMPGDTVKVNICLENADAVRTLGIRDITYDASKLELVGGKWNASNSIMSSWDEDNQTGVIAFESNTALDGNVFTLTFKVIEETDNISIPVSCKIIAREKTEGAAEKELPVNVIAGAVNICSVKRGDVNGDGYIDTADAIHLLRCTMMPDLYPMNQNGDFNGNGTVDSDDAVYLLYHILMPDRYKLK